MPDTCNGWPNRSMWRAATEFLDFDELRAFALTEIEAYARNHGCNKLSTIMDYAEDALAQHIEDTLYYSETWVESDDDGVDYEYMAKIAMDGISVWEGAWYHNGCVDFDDSAIFVDFADAKRYVYEQAESFDEYADDLKVIEACKEHEAAAADFRHETRKNVYFIRRKCYDTHQ